MSAMNNALSSMASFPLPKKAGKHSYSETGRYCLCPWASQEWRPLPWGVPTQSNESDSGQHRHTYTSCQLASRGVITVVRILVTDKPNWCSSRLVHFVLKLTLLSLHHCSTSAGLETCTPFHFTPNTHRCLVGGAWVGYGSICAPKNWAPASSQHPDQRTVDLNMKYG